MQTVATVKKKQKRIYLVCEHFVTFCSFLCVLPLKVSYS